MYSLSVCIAGCVFSGSGCIFSVSGCVFSVSGCVFCIAGCVFSVSGCVFCIEGCVFSVSECVLLQGVHSLFHGVCSVLQGVCSLFRDVYSVLHAGCLFSVLGSVLVCGTRHGVGVRGELAPTGGSEPGSGAAVRGAPLAPSQRRDPPRPRDRLPRTPPFGTPFRRRPRC